MTTTQTTVSARKLTAPSSLYLVYLEAPEETRIQRLRARGVVDGAERRRFDAHSAEMEVMSRLAKLADLRANTSGSAESAAQSVVRRLVRVAERGLL